MAGYIPHYTKKRDRLRRLENDFRRLIELGASREQLLVAATEIREAQVRVLRARQNKIPERNLGEREHFLKVGQQIKAVESLSPDETLTALLKRL